MSKKRVTENSSSAPFSPEIVSQIIKTTAVPNAKPDPQALSSDLNAVVDTYLIWDYTDQEKTLRQQRAQMEKIARHADLLEKALSKANEDGLIDGYKFDLMTAHNKVTKREERHRNARLSQLRKQQQRSIRKPIWFPMSETKASIKALKEWAQGICARITTQVESESGQESDNEASAKAWLVGKGLPEVYGKHFNRPWRFSRAADGNGPPYGPGIRFSNECLKQIHIEMNPEAIVGLRRSIAKRYELDNSEEK